MRGFASFQCELVKLTLFSRADGPVDHVQCKFSLKAIPCAKFQVPATSGERSERADVVRPWLFPLKVERGPIPSPAMFKA